MSSPSIAEQAVFLRALSIRSRMDSGEIADETWLRLDRTDVMQIERIVARLERMAPHEPTIRKLVAGKK